MLWKNKIQKVHTIYLSLTIFGPVLPVLSSWSENVLSSFCLLLSRFLARAMAHLFRESLNSILTPSLTRWGTLGSSSMIAYSRAEPRNCPVNWLATLNSSKLWKHIDLQDLVFSSSNLCACCGLDDIDDHVCCDWVRFKIESSDRFVGLENGKNVNICKVQLSLISPLNIHRGRWRWCRWGHSCKLINSPPHCSPWEHQTSETTSPCWCTWDCWGWCQAVLDH